MIPIHSRSARVIVRLVGVVGAAAMVSSGCSSSPPEQGSSSSSPSSSTVESTSAPAPPPVSDSSPVPGDQGNVPALGPGTLYSGCRPDYRSKDDGSDVVIGDGEVFNPVTGENFPKPTPTIPEGKHAVGVACAVGGVGENIRVFYVLTLATPSAALSPEYQETQVLAFDPFGSGDPTATAKWPDNMDPKDFVLTPTAYGFMAWNALAEKNDIVGFDSNTLQQTFSDHGVFMVNLDGYATEGDPGTVFHSAKDGATLGTSSSYPDDVIGYPHGFGGSPVDSPDEHYYFDMRDGQMKGPLPGGGIVWGDMYFAYDDTDISVWDLKQNKSVFQRSGDEVSELNANAMYFSGKYLYIDNEKDKPVIDITTSKTVSSGWTVRPTDLILNDWVIVSDATSWDSGSCFGGLRTLGHFYAQYFDLDASCTDSGTTLVRAPNGQYPGSWF